MLQDLVLNVDSCRFVLIGCLMECVMECLNVGSLGCLIGCVMFCYFMCCLFVCHLQFSQSCVSNTNFCLTKCVVDLMATCSFDPLFVGIVEQYSQMLRKLLLNVPKS